MRWFDNFLAGFVPQFAVRRLQARQAIKGFYEAAKPSRLHKSRMSSGTPDQETVDLVKLRDLARHLEQNYDLAKGALDVLVDNVVGLGIVPEPQIKNENGDLIPEINKELQALWDDWSRLPEVTWEMDVYEMERLLARSWFRDGEVFGQHVSGNVRGLDHGTNVPYSVELIESDLVPVSKDEESKGIVAGVEKNKWGRPRFYHIHKTHPGGNEFAMSSDTKRVPAANVIHLKTMTRIKQTRGISMFATVLNRMDDIKEIEESERVAARVAAAMTGYIKKGSPDLYIAPDGDNTEREMDMQPGMIYDNLTVGEEVGTIASNRPNSAVIEFRDANIRAVASGLGTGASSISKNYNGTYSSQRQELVESHVHYGILWSVFVSKAVRPIYTEFVKAAIASGKVAVPTGVDQNTLYDAEYSRPSMPWIDPAKEMAGIEKELETRINSRSAIIRRRGGKPDIVRQQIKEEHDQDEEDGLNQVSQMNEDTGGDPNKKEDPKKDDNKDDNQGDDEKASWMS